MKSAPIFLLVFLLAGAASAQARESDEVSEAFARMDSDRDGQLSLQEFEKGITRPYGSQRDGVVYQRLPAGFRALDVDANGFLEEAEYANLASRWPASRTPPPFTDADRSGDGRIDFREFASLHAPQDDAPAEAGVSTN
jgi:Ca2+-binding EF-hand superfamily protein